MNKLSKILHFYCLTNEIKVVNLAKEIGIERRRFGKIMKGGMPTAEEMNKIDAWMLS